MTTASLISTFNFPRLVLSAVRCKTPHPAAVPKIKFSIPPTVKIFENKSLNPNLFRVTTTVAGLQLVVWCYLSYFAVTELESLQKSDPKVKVGQEESRDGEGEAESKGKEEDMVIAEPALFITQDENTAHEGDFDREGGSNGGGIAESGLTKTEQVEEGAAREGNAGNKDGSRKEDDVAEHDLFKWFMSSKWRFSLSLLSLGVGSVFTMLAYIYPQKMIRSLTYIRPTEMLEVVTYSPWGGHGRKFAAPLVDVVCNTGTAAQQAQGQNIPIKIKGHSLFFILNPNNTYIHPMLNSLVLNRRNI